MDAPAQPLLLRLEGRGWRMTVQRRAIATALTGADLHLTAEGVHIRARRAVPGLSLATVYNCLAELVALGEVGQLVTGRGPARYDPNVGAPHHHAVCDGCGDIRDVPTRGSVDRHVTERWDSWVDGDFRVSGVQVVFRGLCEACQGKGAS